MMSTLVKQSLLRVRCTARWNVTRQASSSTASATAAARLAYEEAINLIQVDKKERLQMLNRVEKEIARIAKSATPAQLKALNALKYDLEVKSELNEPEVQRNFKLRNSKLRTKSNCTVSDCLNETINKNVVDMSKPVYRYMRQKEFEKQPKAILMQRITQMNVIPDLLNTDMNPTVQVNIKLPEQGTIEPGIFIKSEESVKLPEIEVVNFHDEPRLYTLMMIDPDSPDVENKTYQQRCHWLISNVSLSATSPIVKEGDIVLDYIPPHPEKGTKYHRYTVIAYEQPNEGKDRVELKVESRNRMNVKNIADQHGLKPTGVSFFREVWDEHVPTIYKDILKEHEPVYGKPPRVQPIIKRAVYYS
ncbi:phosphatidylethanolamine-binding protein [Mycotypha africana]|uniref:phosphatidylethanolamine-binding protein n=1 Tax=Mycotypha africana TaxID=64632 RepID=UPI002301C0DE|nr:phosphatidylethanolamine-binding protein [Mycotypha africana]KAI8992001.1 phosphatidylethanolamine-binding protein [Mycotypha africana]